MPNHDIVAIRETSHRTQKPRVSIKLHVRGSRGGTHGVLASTSPLPAGDPRIEELHAAFRDLADRLQDRADHLCSCPPQSDTTGRVGRATHAAVHVPRAQGDPS